MKRILCMALVLVTLVCCLASCGEGKKGYEACIEYLGEVLYVPSSLIIYEASSVTDKENNRIYYLIEYDAQNRLGNYGGREKLYFMYDIETGKVDLQGEDEYTYILKYANLLQAGANGTDVDYKEYK